MKITLRFLEPFRMLDWIRPEERISGNKAFQRGLTFARWHKSKADDKGKPFITGTLLRSAVIRAAEHLLVLSKGKVGEKACCPGKFLTETDTETNKAPTMFLRKRPTLKWTDRKGCDPDFPCPLCELLGPGAVGKKEGEAGINSYVNFGNLSFPGDTGYSNAREIAVRRVVNRVDYASGKAHDFFRIFEVDHIAFPCFHGEIAFGENVSSQARNLLQDSLRFTDRLCGALCVIRYDGDIPKCGKTAPLPETESIQNAAEETARAIVRVFHGGRKDPEQAQTDKAEQIQLLSAAVRELGRDKKKVSALPLNHEGKEDHYLWDKKAGGETIRTILKAAAEKEAVANQWRQFCIELSEELYKEAKKAHGGLEPARRIMGDAEFSDKSDPEMRPHSVGVIMEKETIIMGTLKAETPFFFGIESKEKKQTDLKLLLDGQNHYRIPRSALRGILRRDIRSVLGTGCNAEVGGRPCLCPVCRIMKNITAMDTRSSTDTLPEVRPRIRLNPFTGSVQEKALFNMEMGTEGIEFPFVLSYRGKKTLPKELRNVLKWWTEGKAFLGGAASTGKSIFGLADVRAFSSDLSDDTARSAYLSNYGWRGIMESSGKNSGPDPESLVKFGWHAEDLELSDIKKYKPFHWQKISVKITLNSPFLNGDPVRALTEDVADIVSFKKYTQGGEKIIYAYKSESFRGVVRTALGRRNQGNDDITGKKNVPLIALTHQDCECMLCRFFGSEYEAGRLYFEDLTFESEPEPRRFDHVAIDRFTGGAVNQKKFDDRSLVPGKEGFMTLSGCFWMRKDKELSRNEIEELGKAFADIRDGLYPLGAKGSMGYGQVAELSIVDDEDSDDENNPAKLLAESMKNASPSLGTPTSLKKKDAGLSLRFDENADYYPYYFLEPEKSVHRDPVPPGHEEAFRGGLLTGRITCRLTVRTPLIVPNTETDDAFNMKEKAGKKKDAYHKSYRFFTLNGVPMIPGSEIRGMISSVFEALSNSCFRIFDEKYRLSWRMDADVKELEQFKPGRVADDGKRIEEMKEIRYPFYDRTYPERNAQNGYFRWDARISLTDNSMRKMEKDGVPRNVIYKLNTLKNKAYKSEKSFLFDLKNKAGGVGRYKKLVLKHAEVRGGEIPYYSHPTPTDCKLLSLVGPNRQLCRQDTLVQYRIIKHRRGAKPEEDFMFVGTPSENQKGHKENNDHGRGYLKISGPNKIEKENVLTSGVPSVPENMGAVVHNCPPRLVEVTVRCGRKQEEECKRKRLVPEYVCADPEKKVTYTMTKRCERIFLEKSRRIIPFTNDAVDKFEILVKEYRRNAEQQDTPEAFQTILPENGTVNPGDLLYFREEKGKAAEIVPVRISRKVDDRHIGKRIDPELRPCHGEWIEDGDLSKLDAYPAEKKLLTRHPKGLCPACRVFGTGSYKSRVRFGFAALKGTPKWLKEDPAEPSQGKGITLPLLERPRPTWAVLHNDKENSEIPGRKFYVHHNGWKGISEGIHPISGEKIEPDENNRTVEVLDKGNRFVFELSFENLEPRELGLLIHSLQLEKGLAHKLGMAKSMGFGSVEIDVESVRVKHRSGEWDYKDGETVDGWIEEGKRGVAAKGKANHTDNLRKLLYLPGEKQNPHVHYPTLKKEKKGDPPGYEDLKKSFREKKLNRRKMLTTPWEPWHK